MRHVYGPVPSRRLGRSLGIDPVPLKTCNFNCVYCQLGRSAPMTNERAIFAEPARVLDDVRRALDAHTEEDIDWITFVGSGEPTLHADLGGMIRQVKRLTRIPIAVITNGALLSRADVRDELAAADAVLPTLDAGYSPIFRSINRPHPEITLDRVVEGLIAFRDEYAGQLWIETMLIKGKNDDRPSIEALVAAMRPIRPDQIHLSLPIRPPAERWVEPPDAASVQYAAARLGRIAQVLEPLAGEFDLAGFESPVEAVAAIIARHPMRQEEIERTLEQWAPGEVNEALADLVATGRAKTVHRYGTDYWTAEASRYR